VFVDVKTAWIIEGLGHGHQDLSKPEAAPGVLSREGNRITANASVVQYNEITPDNIDSFHFHGDIAGNPLSAVIAVPNDEKAGVILQGRYLDPDERSQIVRPVDVMDDLLATILTVRGFVVAAVLLVGAATVATAVLVFLLSLRLRQREMETMVKIGAARGRIAAMLLAEVLGVLVVGGMLAGGLTWLTGRISAETIQKIILSG
jgi:putative ABC transport system permease protein